MPTPIYSTLFVCDTVPNGDYLDVAIPDFTHVAVIKHMSAYLAGTGSGDATCVFRMKHIPFTGEKFPIGFTVPADGGLGGAEWNGTLVVPPGWSLTAIGDYDTGTMYLQASGYLLTLP